LIASIIALAISALVAFYTDGPVLLAEPFGPAQDRPWSQQGPGVTTPLPAPAAPRPEPAEGLTEDQVYALALSVSGDAEWANWFAGVSWCESRWQPDAVGQLGERGLAQVHPVHGSVPESAHGQVVQAYELHEVYGPEVWACA
jgi:hypothetical protein